MTIKRFEPHDDSSCNEQAARIALLDDIVGDSNPRCSLANTQLRQRLMSLFEITRAELTELVSQLEYHRARMEKERQRDLRLAESLRKKWS